MSRPERTRRRPAIVTALVTIVAVAVAAAAGSEPVAEAESRVASTAGIASAWAPFGTPDVCLPDTGPRALDTLFDTEPGGVIGADYQRATELPNGDVLWTFQDAEMRLPDGTTRLVHNIGMVQTGTCFDVLVGGTADAPTSWLFSSVTLPFRRWYWPLDSTMGADGRVYVHLAEMEEMGVGYLEQVIPRSTAVAAFDVTTRTVEFEGAAGDGSPALYGWATETDDEWTYLYAHCHRQFGFDPFFNDTFIHDSSCTPLVTVARVRRGDLFGPRSYWTGSGWSPDPGRAVAILETEGRLSNPADIVEIGGWWLAVVKVDDWWGDTILVEASRYPTGPFTTIATLPATPKCSVDCTTYYASWIPGADTGELLIGLSHNRWDGVISPVYRPSFADFDPPPPTLRVADRCAIGRCD